MLVVTVQLWPGGRPGQARTIAAAGISNLTPEQGSASYALVVLDAAMRRVASGAVLDHSRRGGAWPLVGAVASLASEVSPDPVITDPGQVFGGVVERAADVMSRTIRMVGGPVSKEAPFIEEFDSIAFEIARAKVGAWQRTADLGWPARDILDVAVLLLGTIERFVDLPPGL